jgi:hypothetical protein
MMPTKKKVMHWINLKLLSENLIKAKEISKREMIKC